MDESIRSQVLDFVGKNPVTLANIAFRISGDYPVLHKSLLDRGLDVREFSFERDPQTNYDSSTPALAGRKLLVADTDLGSDDYFFIAKRLARTGSFDFRYLTQNPQRVHTPEDLFLEAYSQGMEMKPQDLGADVQRFVQKYREVVGSGFKVAGSAETRRLALGIALAINDQRRDVYTDSPGKDCLVVYLDKRKNPRIRRGDRKRKILLVEDTRDSAKVLTDMIRGHNDLYEIEVFTDAEKGLERLKKERPDVVITDVMMPHVNGLEIAEEAGQLKTPVILMTAYPDRYASREAQRLGIRYFFEKPISTEKLMDAIEDLTWAVA